LKLLPSSRTKIADLFGIAISSLLASVFQNSSQ